MSTTTIQVTDDTKRLLDAYRTEVGAETYEDVIGHLLRTSGAESAFGSVEDWASWEDDDRMRFRTETGDA